MTYVPVPPEFTLAVAELYNDRTAPTDFLTSFFIDREPTNQMAITMDVIRNKERVAVDIIPGTGPNQKFQPVPYTAKTYVPPEYDEPMLLTADSMLKRMAGATAYDPANYAAITAAEIATGQQNITDAIKRAIEVQSRDALVYGQVTLVNNETVNFHQKSTHQIVTDVDWSNPASNIVGDLSKAGDVIRTDGKVAADMAIFGKDALNNLFSNDEIIRRINFRRADMIAIKPTRINIQGAKFIGVGTFGAYEYEIWTYPQEYEVPTGFGLPSEGEKVPYIPDDKVVVLYSKARFDLFWGAIPRFANGNFEGAAAAGVAASMIAPVGRAMRYDPYFYLDNTGKALTVGVRSRPIVVPTAIDTYAVITTVAD